MKIVQVGPDRLSIVPETEFEAKHLGEFFFASESRKIVVKSGTSLEDTQSVDIVVSKIKCPITIPDPVKMCGCNEDAEPKPCSCATEAVADVPLVPNSLANLVKE